MHWFDAEVFDVASGQRRWVRLPSEDERLAIGALHKQGLACLGFSEKTIRPSDEEVSACIELMRKQQNATLLWCVLGWGFILGGVFFGIKGLVDWLGGEALGGGGFMHRDMMDALFQPWLLGAVLFGVGMLAVWLAKAAKVWHLSHGPFKAVPIDGPGGKPLA